MNSRKLTMIHSAISSRFCWRSCWVTILKKLEIIWVGSVDLYCNYQFKLALKADLVGLQSSEQKCIPWSRQLLKFGLKRQGYHSELMLMPSPSASSKFVLGVLKLLGILKFLSYTQNILGVLKWANLCSKI